jgi:hypothetical protein
MAQEEWGGEVRLPGWLRRVLRRPDPAGDTPERAHEGRQTSAEDFRRLDRFRAGGSMSFHPSELPGAEPKRKPDQM